MQTKKQDLTNKIKHFIEEYYGQYGTSPSIRCIAENVGCSKSNVTIYIDYLKEQGLLEIGEGGYETEVTRPKRTLLPCQDSDTCLADRYRKSMSA